MSKLVEKWLLEVRSCNFYNNKYMIVSTQITNAEIFTSIAVLVFKLFSRKVLLLNRKTVETVKGRLLFEKIPNFTGKLMQNYKYLESEIFRILLKHVSDHLSVLFQFV